MVQIFVSFLRLNIFFLRKIVPSLRHIRLTNCQNQQNENQKNFVFFQSQPLRSCTWCKQDKSEQLSHTVSNGNCRLPPNCVFTNPPAIRLAVVTTVFHVCLISNQQQQATCTAGNADGTRLQESISRMAKQTIPLLQQSENMDGSCVHCHVQLGFLYDCL